MKLINKKFDIGASDVTLFDIYQVAKNHVNIFLSKESIAKINYSRQYLEKRIKKKDELIYGVNTGFGSLCDHKIDSNKIELLQKNLVKSHNAGTGAEIPNLITKIILLLKIRSLSFGYSAVRLELVDRLIYCFNNNILPNIREQGSLGASGDLAPLAALADMIISHNDEKKINIKPIKLSFKEGLALLNGTQFMSAYGLNAIVEAKKIYHFSNLIASISLEAFVCKKGSFNPLVSSVRRHSGQVYTANQILKILDGSKTFTSNTQYVQDPYSFRCIPQVHGASFDVINHVEDIFQTEIDSVTDNPLVFPDSDLIISAGNFHGQSLAMSMDYLSIAISELGNISERRTFNLISGTRNLPLYLTKNPGIESGLMIAQYTAASIVSQNKQYSTPSSIDSIVSSNGQEDHVSMGANSALKLHRIIENLKTILAIELLNGLYAIQLQPMCKGKSSPCINKFLKKIDFKINLGDANSLRDEIDAARNFLDKFDVLSFLKIHK